MSDMNETKTKAAKLAKARRDRMALDGIVTLSIEVPAGDVTRIKALAKELRTQHTARTGGGILERWAEAAKADDDFEL